MPSRSALRAVLSIIACVSLTACTGGGSPRGDTGACLFTTQRPALEIDMYFGRDIPAGGSVTDADWADFVARDVTPRFPGGFTVFDATGQWLSPESHQVVREATKVIQLVQPVRGTLPDAVRAVAAAYKTRFKQDAVGIVSKATCAAF
jgi:hypothetical protein